MIIETILAGIGVMVIMGVTYLAIVPPLLYLQFGEVETGWHLHSKKIKDGQEYAYHRYVGNILVSLYIAVGIVLGFLLAAYCLGFLAQWVLR